MKMIEANAGPRNFLVNRNLLDFSEEDLKSLLEILFDNELVEDSELTNMESLAVEAGIFKSRGDARKNNFVGPIPFGFNCFGTKKKWFFVWNPIKHNDEIIISDSFIRSF